MHEATATKHTLNLTQTSLVMLVAMLLGGCLTVTPAPGADKVHVTRNPKEVAACKAVGNIAVPRADNGLFRNRAVGLGGNTALVTAGLVSAPVEGIA